MGIDLSSGDTDPAADIEIDWETELPTTDGMVDKIRDMSMEEYAQYRESLMKSAGTLHKRMIH